jgi:hypothetical protein
MLLRAGAVAALLVLVLPVQALQVLLLSAAAVLAAAGCWS